jgi:hypothetical protein
MAIKKINEKAAQPLLALEEALTQRPCSFDLSPRIALDIFLVSQNCYRQAVGNRIIDPLLQPRTHFVENNVLEDIISIAPRLSKNLCPLSFSL